MFDSGLLLPDFDLRIEELFYMAALQAHDMVVSQQSVLDASTRRCGGYGRSRGKIGSKRMQAGRPM